MIVATLEKPLARIITGCTGRPELATASMPGSVRLTCPAAIAAATAPTTLTAGQPVMPIKQIETVSTAKPTAIPGARRVAVACEPLATVITPHVKSTAPGSRAYRPAQPPSSSRSGGSTAPNPFRYHARNVNPTNDANSAPDRSLAGRAGRDRQEVQPRTGALALQPIM